MAGYAGLAMMVCAAGLVGSPAAANCNGCAATPLHAAQPRRGPVPPFEPPASLFDGDQVSEKDSTDAPALTDVTQSSDVTDLSDVVVTARPPSERADPLRGVNAASFDAAQRVDLAVIGPAARVYERRVPGPIRSGLRNFLDNLHEPSAIVNYLLQLKPGKAAETAARFALNTTVGVAGLVDVAKRRPFRLPHRRNGFANTMGYYGVGPGPYLFLPIIGPTTVRDLAGLQLDGFVLPMTMGRPVSGPAYVASTRVVRALDKRAGLDAQLQEFRDSADPYASRRDAYLRSRREEIGRLRVHTYRERPNPSSLHQLPGLEPATLVSKEIR